MNLSKPFIRALLNYDIYDIRRLCSPIKIFCQAYLISYVLYELLFTHNLLNCMAASTVH